MGSCFCQSLCERCFSTDLTTFLGTGSGGKGESYCQSSGRPESQFLLWAVWQTVHQTPGIWQPHKLLWPCSQAGTCDTNVFGIVNIMFFVGGGTEESIIPGIFRFYSGLVFVSYRGSKNWSRESLLEMCHRAPAKMEKSKKRCCVDYMSSLSRENSLTGKILPQECPLLVGWLNASEVHVEHIRCLGKMIVWMCFQLNSLKWTALSQVHTKNIYFSSNLVLCVCQYSRKWPHVQDYYSGYRWREDGRQWRRPRKRCFDRRVRRSLDGRQNRARLSQTKSSHQLFFWEKHLQLPPSGPERCV